MAAETEYGVIILNAPLAGETGLELAEELAERSRTSILLLVREELMSVFFQPATEAGVLVVGKPVVPQVFRQSVWMAAAMRNRLLALGRANEKLHARLEETRVIDRAKCLLIQHRQLSEAEAHHALERLAMDRRTTKVKAAMEVLRRFGM